MSSIRTRKFILTLFTIQIKNVINTKHALKRSHGKIKTKYNLTTGPIKTLQPLSLEPPMKYN